MIKLIGFPDALLEDFAGTIQSPDRGARRMKAADHSDRLSGRDFGEKVSGSLGSLLVRGDRFLVPMD